MPAALVPANESDRLEALRRYDLLDTPPEVAFDDITELAAQICGTPIATISLVDENRQWFKSSKGMSVRETSRDVSFCAHAILLKNELMVVADATHDWRLADYESVTGEDNYRFYAGMPLQTPDGFAIGTLCVIDHKPRDLTVEQANGLKALSRLVLAQLQLRSLVGLQHDKIQSQKEVEEELERRVFARNTELLVLNGKLARAKEAAEAATVAKTEFLRNVSHELRTPLNGILGTTEFLMGSDDMTPESKSVLALTQESAQGLLEIVNDVLNLSSLDMGTVRVEKQEFEVRRMAKSAIDVFRAEAYGKSLKVSLQVSPEVPETIKGDPQRLRQILARLVGNAVKFTNQGEIHVIVEQKEMGSAQSCLCFTVSDTGIGIPIEKQKLIFEPFTQADGSLTRKYGGTGLGLTICARLVELMNGCIWVESEPGRGSSFHFTVMET